VSTGLGSARAFAEALFADEDGPPPAERMDWLMRDLEDFVDQAGVRVRAILTGGLFAATWVAPALSGHAPPLSRLSISERCRALDKLERSPLGLPLLAVKAVVCILYYEHPDVLREAGVTSDVRGNSCLLPTVRSV